MKIIADLHMHSTSSDGKYAPEAIFAKAVKAGLSTFSLSDHDTIDHIPKIKACLQKYGTDIQFIPSSEISCEHNGDPLHILAYFLKDDIKYLTDIFRKMKIERKSVIEKMGEKLNDLGYDIDFTKILNKTDNPGRPHLANALIKAGYFQNLKDVFDQLLGHNKPGYIKKNKPSAYFVIDKIRDLGGVSILAHPGVYSNLSKVEIIKELNIDGIEVFHPDHNLSQTQYYTQFAEGNDLLITGGSDFHGWEDESRNPIGSFGIGAEYFKKFFEFIN